jgi:anti-sigma B factor antagonist
MEIQEQIQGAVTVIKPAGPLTQADAEQFRANVLEVAGRSAGRFVIEVSSIAFIDSVGVETLVDLTEKLGESGQALKLCAANDTLREVLDLTGWSDAFEFYDDLNKGVRSFL